MTEPTTNRLPNWANPNATVGRTKVSHGMEEKEFLDQPYSTLDETVKETIMKDASSVWRKIKVVFLPIRKVCILLFRYFFFHVKRTRQQQSLFPVRTPSSITPAYLRMK